MKLEIFTVTTKLREIDKTRLEIVQTDLTRLFSGLTIIPKCLGFWLNDTEHRIEKDNIEIWLIYTKDLTFKIRKEKFLKLLTEIKDITQQKEQAYSIDNTIKFL